MTLGILGGGQLGRMLWDASCDLSADLRPSPVFHNVTDCPAGLGGAQITLGEITETEKLTEFFKKVDSFAAENEFLNIEAIDKAWRDSRSQTVGTQSLPIPSLEGLRIAQDKLEQKKFFIANSLPTSEYQEITTEWLETSEKLKSLHQKWQGFVLKKARMGYDGKGNLAVSSTAPWDFEALKSFCQSAFEANSRVYAEKFVPFAKEVALVSCQNAGGDYGHYPLVETVQRNGVCYLAFRALREEKNQQRAMEAARVIVQKLNLLGAFAVEFFVTQAGDLLVNEMAPRVHNSGHFSQKASKSSQFEMHLKSYWQKQWNQKDFESAKAFAMVNFLGPEDIRGPVQRPKNPQIYWYDKESTSPGRKLGHMIMQSRDEKDLPQLIGALKSSEQAWQESLRSL